MRSSLIRQLGELKAMDKRVLAAPLALGQLLEVELRSRLLQAPGKGSLDEHTEVLFWEKNQKSR